MSIGIKNKDKKRAEKELSRKIGLFDKIPERCLTCNIQFDKKNKEMVMSWYVVVRAQEENVNLYCPECWNKAKKIIEEYKDGLPNAV